MRKTKEQQAFEDGQDKLYDDLTDEQRDELKREIEAIVFDYTANLEHEIQAAWEEAVADKNDDAMQAMVRIRAKWGVDVVDVAMRRGDADTCLAVNMPEQEIDSIEELEETAEADDSEAA